MELLAAAIGTNPTLARIMRLARVFRLMRAFRVVKSVKGLQMLLSMLVRLPEQRLDLLLLLLGRFLVRLVHRGDALLRLFLGLSHRGPNGRLDGSRLADGW